MSAKPTILVSGADGQLGKALLSLESKYSAYRFVFLTRTFLDISRADNIDRIFSEYQPQYVINCAAYTAVDLAQQEQDAAFAINSAGPGLLAESCRKLGAHFLHISTDYVFDGTADKPYREDDKTSPQNVYGESKLEGEKLVLKNEPGSIIIRTSWVYSENGKNFVKTMIRLMHERESVSVLNDQKGSPTYAVDLAEAIMAIIGFKTWMPGIYNFSNEGLITWYEFAVAIKGFINSNCIVKGISTAEYPTPAKRPAFSGLDKTKIQNTFSIPVKDWKSSLEICINNIR